MSEFKPVEMVADLESLDQDDIVAGYRQGWRDATEPGSDKSRGYWHGWRNAQMDAGRMALDIASARLCREHLGARVRWN
jgi:hypothetical protein